MCRRSGRPSGCRRATAASRPPEYAAALLVVHQLFPDRNAEALAGHRQVVENVVLGMDPRDPQADGRHAGLHEVLLEHGLFQHLRERIVTGVGGQGHVFANRDRLRMEVDPVHGVTAGQNHALRRLAVHGRIQQIERALNTDLDQCLAIFLAGCQMNDRIAVSDQFLDQTGIGHVPPHFFDAGNADAVSMGQRADLVPRLHQGFAQGGPQFPAGPGYKHASDRTGHGGYLRGQLMTNGE